MTNKFGEENMQTKPVKLNRYQYSPQYRLRSLVSQLANGDFGVFDSVSMAVEHAMWCGLPGEEFEVERKSDGMIVAKIVTSNSKLSLLL